MIKTVYQCDKCGAIFDDYTQASKHEDNAHVDFNLYRSAQAVSYRKYPDTLLIPMKNGTTGIYCLIGGLPKSVKTTDFEEEPFPEAANE